MIHWAMLGVLLTLWLLGTVSSVEDTFIHILFVVALIVLIIELAAGRRSAV